MTNPLQNYFRKPEIYMRLPSQGRWYPPGSLDMNDQGEVAVMSMTAKDEMIIKTPDALLNGSSTVEVLKSCVPGIKDPWQMPSMDVDTLLLGIRIATYGDMMTMVSNPPSIGVPQEVQVNLNQLVSTIPQGNYNDTCVLSNGLTIKSKPNDYRAFTKGSLKTYEEQRLLRTVTDSELSESEKLDKFTKIFTGLSTLTIDTMANMIVEITPQEGEPVTSHIHIKDFVYNMDTKIANEIKAHMTSNNKIGGIPPITVTSTEEQKKAGAPDTYESTISFDNSNFFVSKS